MAGRRGFTLIEIMVAAAVLGVGIAAVFGCFAALSRAKTHENETAAMQQLAVEKYQELVATQQLTSSSLNGDFTDRGNSQYVWKAAVQPTQTQDVDGLSVTVSPSTSSSNNSGFTVNGLVYVPPTQTNGAGGAPGGTP